MYVFSVIRPLEKIQHCMHVKDFLVVDKLEVSIFQFIGMSKTIPNLITIENNYIIECVELT